MSLQQVIEYRAPSWSSREDGVEAFFTTKNEDTFNADAVVPGLNTSLNSAQEEDIVQKNREMIYSQFDLDPHWVAWGKQVHSTRVQIVMAGGLHPDTDGLVTAVPRLALAIQVADCAAILLADPERRIIAAVHAGWRGAAGGIIPQAVQKMKSLRADASRIKAYISPCISLENFEVGAEVAEQFPDEFVDWESFKKPHVDLKGFVAGQLKEEGVPGNSIEVDPACTLEREHEFYSYRREKEKSGRMLGLIVLR